MSLFALWAKGQRVETELYSFKVIVLLPQTKVPSRFRSESSAFSMLSSTGIADRQTFDFKYRELDMFLPQTKVCNSH